MNSNDIHKPIFKVLFKNDMVDDYLSKKEKKTITESSSYSFNSFAKMA